MKQHNVKTILRDAARGKEKIVPALLRIVEKQINTQLAQSDQRISMANDPENELVVVTSTGPADEYHITWSECFGEEPELDLEPVVDMEAVLAFAGKTEAQWNNLKEETQQDWVSRWLANQS